jgi:hypothetical protein
MEIAGSAEVDRGFEPFSPLVDDWSPLWEEMVDVFVATEIAPFETEGAAESDNGEQYLMLRSIRELNASKDQKDKEVDELKRQVEELRSLVTQITAQRSAQK